jgi:hypothetical protein
VETMGGVCAALVACDSGRVLAMRGLLKLLSSQLCCLSMFGHLAAAREVC